MQVKLVPVNVYMEERASWEAHSGWASQQILRFMWRWKNRCYLYKGFPTQPSESEPNSLSLRFILEFCTIFTLIILPNLIALLIFGGEYRLWRSEVCTQYSVLYFSRRLRSISLYRGSSFYLTTLGCHFLSASLSLFAHSTDRLSAQRSSDRKWQTILVK